jgi:hypothetical protein
VVAKVSGVELWTLDGTDEEYDEVIAVLRYALGVAEEAEVISPDTATSLRQWCNVEYKRLHPPAPRVTPEQEVRAWLQRSPYFPFWSTLEKEQEVRWTDTKTATYFVVDPDLHPEPDASYGRCPAAYIELRRHSGKTFWTHIAKVRPLEATDG